MIGNPEQRIRTMFSRIGTDLAGQWPFLYKGWIAYSQYGYVMEEGFETKEAAEKYVIDYYSARMNLIDQ
jgi:hypothetical protein